MARERKPKGPKRAAAPKGDFWDVVCVNRLTLPVDSWSKDGAIRFALEAFLHGATGCVYIESRTTGEEIDCTAEMRKVEEEYRRRRSGGEIALNPDDDDEVVGEIDDIIRAILLPAENGGEPGDDIPY